MIKPVDTRLGQARGVLEKACWRQESARLCVQADYDARERRLQAELVEWPLARLQADLPLSVQLKDSLLAAQLKARVPLQGLALADAQLQVSPGSLNWDEAGQQKQAVYGGADAQLHLDAEGARATAQLQLTGADTLHTISLTGTIATRVLVRLAIWILQLI